MNITEEYIKSVTNSAYYERGCRYYKDGAVFNCKESDNEYAALVSGTHDYTVTIDKNDLECSCTCPAYEMSKTCKHIVAVLLTIMNKGCNNKPREKAAIIKRSSKPINNLQRKKIIKNTNVKEVISQLKSLIRSQHRYFQRWDDYFNQQDQIVSDGIELLQKLPNTIESGIACLELGKWYDKELEKIDDSNGTNQDLLMEILQIAVQIFLLSNSDINTIMKIIEQYIYYDGSFGFGSNVAEAIFQYPEKTEFDERLGLFCDRKDEEKILGLRTMWCFYLQNHKDLRFEETALRFYKDNIDLTQMLVKHYFAEEQYKKVVHVSWDFRSSYLIEEDLHSALKELNDDNYLTIFLQEKLNERFDKTKFNELHMIFKKNNVLDKWNQFVNGLFSKYDIYNLLQILMTLRKYKEVTRLLIKDKIGFNISIEQYALKLSVLDPESGKRLYWNLVKQEEQKFTTSNYYLRFFGYIYTLLEMNDKDNIVEYLKRIITKYPTKRKLSEEIYKIIK